MSFLFHSRDRDAQPEAETIPTVFPSIEGADIAAVFVGKRIAGDFYDSVRVSPERILFGLLDVAGRRDDNRTILAAAQDVFRSFGAELFSREDINEADAMTELSLRINRTVIDSAKRVLSCPAFIACYHEKFGTLCYTNAGHIPALLRDGSGISELASTGLPLGLFSHATADARIVGIQDGSALLLVSRGVISCEGHGKSSSDEFGMERVKTVLQETPPGRAKDLCDSVLQSVATFSAHGPVCDDRTALALIRTS